MVQGRWIGSSKADSDRAGNLPLTPPPRDRRFASPFRQSPRRSASPAPTRAPPQQQRSSRPSRPSACPRVRAGRLAAPRHPPLLQSMPSNRPAKRAGRSLRSQSSSSDRRRPAAKRSTPRRNSASVITLRNNSSSSWASRNATMPGFGRGFVHSETMLVSSRKLTVRCRAHCPCCAGHSNASPAKATRRETRQGCRPDWSAVPTPRSRQQLPPAGRFG